MSSYITTYSKVKFNPLDPNEEDILVDDIAHALSLMSRANGHFPEFFSVGQHSIACCEEAIARGYSTRVALACLLHDASEAYMSDVTRPIKKHLHVYLEVEEMLQNTIYKTFIGDELTEDELGKLKSIDDALLHHEFIHYMDQIIPVEHPELVTKPEFKFIEFKKIEDKFKDLFNELSEKIKVAQV